jgi:hypothetical protein
MYYSALSGHRRYASMFKIAPGDFVSLSAIASCIALSPASMQSSAISPMNILFRVRNNHRLTQPTWQFGDQMESDNLSQPGGHQSYR